MSEGFWAKAPIENNATVGLVQGYPDGTFRPDRTLTRAELATLMVRTKDLVIDLSEGKNLKIKLPDSLKDIERLEIVFVGETKVSKGLTISDIGLSK